MIMLKLIEAKWFGTEIQSISGTLEEFKNGSREEEKEAKNWTTARFTQQVNVALKDWNQIPLITSELNTMKYNREW